MVKKSSGEVGSARCADRTSQRDVPTTKLKPSVLLDFAALTVMEILNEQIARKLT